MGKRNVLDSVKYRNTFARAHLEGLTREQKRVAVEGVNNACLTHIKRRAGELEKKRLEKQVVTVRVKKGVMEFRLPEADANGGGGERGNVTGFSRQSRKRMMILLASWKYQPQWWQTFTFDDSMMAGKSISERAKYSNQVLERFRGRIERRYGDRVEAVWRREWEHRKSGVLMGELCPHFHLMVWWEDFQEEMWLDEALWLARGWVESTGTEEVGKALSVAVHPDSYERLHTVNQAIYYASKYMAKVTVLELGAGESLGRMWGKIGSIETDEGSLRELTWSDRVHLGRLLRKHAVAKWRQTRPETRLKWSRMKKVLRQLGNCVGWTLLPKNVALDMLWWVWGQTQKQVGCPF